MVKKRYKQTEIGVIPEDWESTCFGENVKIYRGGSPRPIQDYITHLSTGINWIKIGDVGENDKYIRSTQEKIIPEGVSKSREVHVGDFILSNSMSFGRPYILDIDLDCFKGAASVQPEDPGLFLELARNAVAVTVSRERDWVRLLNLDYGRLEYPFFLERLYARLRQAGGD